MGIVLWFTVVCMYDCSGSNFSLSDPLFLSLSFISLSAVRGQGTFKINNFWRNDLLYPLMAILYCIIFIFNYSAWLHCIQFLSQTHALSLSQMLPPHVRVWDSVSLNTLHVIGMGVFDRAVTCVAFSKSVSAPQRDYTPNFEKVIHSHLLLLWKHVPWQ